MRVSELTENKVYKLGDLAQITTNFEDAHFWIVRRGSVEMVGKPVKEYNPESFGVGVFRTDIIDPGYLYYWMQYLHSQGYWKNKAYGSLRLVNIRLDDILSIQLRVG
jgi:hypothetical protein